MLRKATVAVRYCGGCNPYYDAAAATARLEQMLGRKLSRWDGAKLPDICIVMKQCTSDCFSSADTMAEETTFLLEREADIPKTAQRVVGKIRELESQLDNERG